jgi:protein involved in polysaccharide export with SLBB domain
LLCSNARIYLSQVWKFDTTLMQLRASFPPHVLCTFALLLLTASPALAMVHAGDDLQVTVYNHPELTRKVTVNASEELSLPLAGTIDVRGLEPKQIAAKITDALAMSSSPRRVRRFSSPAVPAAC